MNTKVGTTLSMLLSSIYLILSAAAPTYAQVYAIQDLGTLPQGSDCYAYNLNDAGQVVGSSGSNGFLWTNGQMTSLSLPGGTISFAMGINTQGAVVGESYMSNNIPRAFEYVGGTVYDLLLGGPQGSSYANGINSLGQIVGVATIPVGPTHAFLRDTASDTTYDLGTLGGASSEAYAINSLSQVVGSAYTAQNRMHAFLWTPNGGMIDLGSLAGANGVSTASNVNDLTQVVGYSTSSTYVHAFYWSQATGMTDLGTLGGNTSFAYGINNQSQVVGCADTGISGQTHAFLWTAASGLQDINAFLPANSGWQLQEAKAINNVGQYDVPLCQDSGGTLLSYIPVSACMPAR
jgi:probable HAF family extracellular repeat protein